MTVVHLSYDYGLKGLSGAPIAATRLHKALIAAGVDSHFICLNQTESGVNVHLVPSSWLGRRLFYLLTRGLWVITRILFGRIYMPNIIPLFSFSRIIRKLDPDVIHAHFIYQDMLSFNQLAHAPGRLVVSLHDLTAINAVEPHPKNDRRFAEGFVKGNSSCIERWIFNRKVALAHVKKSVFICPSRWVKAMVSMSVAGKGREAVVIPNIADPAFGYDAAKRKHHGKFVVLFGAVGGRSSPYKGWSDLESSLKELPRDVCGDIEVHVFGESARDYAVNGAQIHFIGNIPDVESMKDVHARADVFAFPSRNETFGQTKVEALIDGLPVLVFNRTGCAEFVRHKENGWVAEDGDVCAYAKGIEYYYRLFKEGKLDSMRAAISDDAKKAFSGNVLAKEYSKLYAAAVVSHDDSASSL